MFLLLPVFVQFCTDYLAHLISTLFDTATLSDTSECDSCVYYSSLGTKNQTRGESREPTDEDEN